MNERRRVFRERDCSEMLNTGGFGGAVVFKGLDILSAPRTPCRRQASLRPSDQQPPYSGHLGLSRSDLTVGGDLAQPGRCARRAGLIH